MIAKKKGRRPKSYYENLKLLDLSNNIIQGETIEGETIQGETTEGETVVLDSSTNVVHKKRGRKPKGGKLIEEKKEVIEVIQKPNIILHLNCKLNEITSNELKYNPNIDNIIEFDNNYNIFNNTNSDSLNANTQDALDDQSAQNDLTDLNDINDLNALNGIALSGNALNPNALSANALNPNTHNAINNSPFLYEKKLLNDNVTDNKNIYKKLLDLSKQLKSNNITKKCACFWCTYDFDNDPIMIPKYELKGTYHCYGNFCSPECAASFLMNENVDSSKKFERYYLLNNVYCKIYNYEKNIKCAPSPFYMLEKYYGNLNIQEYRKLLKNERLLLLVDKPLAKLLPELYDENEDYILNNKHINKKAYKINVK
jgi:hypothetical protein|uniref:MYM-type domain-containing protein n=1 Tax=viral metagenome TaxID=1070528 RepID=A0A6C0CDT3_9ZZZZ